MTVIIVTYGLVAFLLLFREYNKFDDQSHEIKRVAFDVEEKKLAIEVKKTLQYINFRISEGMDSVRASLIKKVDRALRVASTLYENNAGTLSKDELKRMITSSLHALDSPDDKNRYIFVTGEDEFKTPGSEGNGDRTSTESLIRGIKDKRITFIEYKWKKPGDKSEKEFKKISYIRYFEPYNLFIGAGEYLDDMEEGLKKELFRWIKTVKLCNKDNYLFVITNKGETIFSSREENLTAQFYKSDHKRILESLKKMYHKAIFSSNGGSTRYLWKNKPEGLLEGKVCFVEYFQKWEWAVGAGSDLDKINKSIDAKKDEAYADLQKQFFQILVSLLFVLCASLLVNFYATRKAKVSMKIFLEFFEKSVNENVQMDIDGVNFAEFEKIATAANKVIRERSEVISELRQFKQMMDGANFGMIITSPSGIVRYTNKYFALRHGCQPEELEGLDFRSLFPLKNKDSTDKILKKIQENGEFSSKEIWLKNKDGKPYPVMMTGKTISNKNAPAYHIISAIDISQEKEIEEKLCFTQISLDSASIGVMWIKEDGSIFYANDAATKKLGADSSEELMKLKINDIDVNSIYGSRKKHWEHLKNSGSIFFRTTYRTPQGKLIPMEVNDYYLNYKDNEFEFVFMLDITEKIKAERALRESEFKFQELFNNMMDGVLIYGPVKNGEDFIICDINKAGEEITSCIKKNIKGQSLQNVFPHAAETGLTKALQNVYKTGRPEKLPGAFYSRANDEAWAKNHVYRLPSGEIVSVFEDVTEREKAASALLQSEKKYRELVESANSIILRLKFDGTIIFLNEYGQKFFGFSMEELKGKNVIGTIVPQYDSNGANMGFLLYNLCKEPWKYAVHQNENILKDGTLVWIAWTNKVLTNADGTPSEILCVGNDITKNRKTEEELKEKLAFEKTISNIASRFVNLHGTAGLDKAIESALGDIALLCPASGGVIFSSEKDTETLKQTHQWNKSKKTAQGSPMKEITAIAAKHIFKELQSNRYIWINSEGNSTVLPSELSILIDKVTVSSLLILPINMQSETKGFIGFENPEIIEKDFSNVLNRLKPCSELIAGAIMRQKAETEALLRQEQLVNAEKMVSLGILSAGVAHEINNPANFIMLNTPLLHDVWKDTEPILKEFSRSYGDFKLGGIPYGETGKTITHLFEGIMDGVERIKRIVSGLRDYARKDSQDTAETVHIDKVVNVSLTLLSNVIKRSTASCKVKIQEGLPPVKGTSQKLEQVLINIIQNACQSDPDKKIALEVTAYLCKKSRNIVIRINDDGKGIPQKFLKHIIDPFFTTKQNRGGTGLGLSISAGIIKEHSGEMTFTSKEGVGTTVAVSLPVHPEYKNT